MPAGATDAVRSPRLPAPLQLLGFFARPTAFMERCHARYGDVFALRMPATEEMVFLADPELVRTVWSNDKLNGLPAGRKITLEPVLGSRSVLLQQGAEHLRSRRIMLPAFHGDRMRAYGETIDALTREEIARLPVGTPFALMPRMQAITREVILRAVFGTEEGPREQELRAAIDEFLAHTVRFRSQMPVLFAQATGLRVGSFHRALAAIDRIVHEVIAERGAAGDLGERTDILSLLLQARDDDGSPLSGQELRDQLVTLLLAGHETTATALSWAFDALFRNPEVAATLQASLADGDEYLDAVVEETMRIRPTVHDVGRRLGFELDLGDGRTLAPGTAVFAPIWLLHQRPDLFPEPGAFRPERFLAGERPSGFAWIPFGGGMRRCLGASFAQFEMRRVLRTILETTTLEPATDRAERIIRRAVTAVPEHGTPAVLTYRA